MSDKVKQTKTSRRARRREQAEVENRQSGERDSSPELDSSPDSERDSDPGPDSEDDRDSDVGPDSDGDRDSSPDSDSSPGSDQDSDPGPDSEDEEAEIRKIRDRNQRLRARAAAKRRARRKRDGAIAAVDAGDSSIPMDALLSQGSAKASALAKKFGPIVLGVAALGLLGALGWSFYNHQSGKVSIAASEALAAGISAEVGQIEAETPLPTEMGIKIFKDHTARLAEAEAAYRKAEADVSSPAAVVLAKLGKAGILFDQGKFDEAKAEYEAVLSSEFAKSDVDIRGRAAEGVALALEGKGSAPEAIKSFKQLEEIGAFKPLAQYHQARLAYAAGDKEQAKTLLTQVLEKLKDDKFARTGYVYGLSLELLGLIDPEAAQAAQKAVEKSPEEMLKELQEMQERLKDMQGGASDVLKQLGIGGDEMPPVPLPPNPNDAKGDEGIKQDIESAPSGEPENTPSEAE